MLGLLVILSACQPGAPEPSNRVSVDVTESAPIKAPPKKACRFLQGEVLSRLGACLGELKSPQLSSAIRDLVANLSKNGPVLVMGAKLDLDVEQKVLELTSEVLKPLMATDETLVAKQLRDDGVRGIVVYRDLVGALDRDATVLSRLAQHDHLRWFQLRHVSADLMLYTVRSSPTRVPLKTGSGMIEGLRARLEGRAPIAQAWRPGSVRLLGTARLQGRTLVTRHAAGADLERVLDELALKMKTRWEREVETEGMGALADRLDELRLGVHIVMEKATVEPRSREEIFDLWELGVDGMMFRHREGIKNQKFTYLPGSEGVIRSMASADEFLRVAVKEGGWRDTRPWEDKSTRLFMIRTQHFIEKDPAGGVQRLYRAIPEVPMKALTQQTLEQMMVEGADWWLRNMHADGSINYKYWPTQNRMSDNYNEVRHILAARDLADAWRVDAQPRYLEGSRRTMDWLLNYEVHDTDMPHATLPHPPEGTLLFRYGNNQKLGTVAVALLGWVAWAETTGSHVEDERIRKMAQFVLSMAEDNGKFQAYLVPRGHSYFGNKNDIVPGEAALALGMVAQYFDELQWLEFFPKFLDFYEPWFRSRAANVVPYGRWPHSSYTNQTRLDLVQFGPWAVMACKQYYMLTGDERAAIFGLEIADWMIEYYQWDEERSPFPDYVGGYYKLPEELPAMQSFCYSEGTAAAYHIAAQFKPEVRKKYALATLETLRFLRMVQYNEGNSYYVARPELIHGGVKYALNLNKIRIDYVGHALSTVSQYLDAQAFDREKNGSVAIP